MRVSIFVIVLITLNLACEDSLNRMRQKKNQHHQHDHHHQHSYQHSHQHSHQHWHEHRDHQGQNITEQTQDEQFFLSTSNQTAQQKILQFFISCQKEIDEWIYITKPLSQVLQNCNAYIYSQQLLQFYASLKKQGPHFSKSHIDLIIQLLKKHPEVRQVLKCITEQKQLENHYLEEAKKYKHLARFISKYPQQANEAFPKRTSYAQSAQKTCHFLKALFQFYYLEVLRPSGTLSTEFLRALTVRSQVFLHEDIAFCIQIESVGRLSEHLQDIDINNVYVKLPEVFQALRFLKLKPECRDAHHRSLVGRLQTALEGLDMFKIMYQDYQPFVQIATEKMVQTQIRLLARKFADIIAQKQKYIALSQIEL